MVADAVILSAQFWRTRADMGGTGRTWNIRDKQLSETKTYKYLGVIINKRMRDSNHISDHLEEKGNKLESYVRYTLANNMDISRVKLGDTLWSKPVLPDTCSRSMVLWYTEIKTHTLQSLQYKCAPQHASQDSPVRWFWMGWYFGPPQCSHS